MTETKRRKDPLAVRGAWIPVPLPFLRSRACAQLSTHASKLLLDALSMLSTNAKRNGDISLTPKLMAPRGWTSRETLSAAIYELVESGILIKTKQGSREDTNLYALTLYPLDCDQSKIDIRPSAYQPNREHAHGEPKLLDPPTEAKPVRWRQVRKFAKDRPRKPIKTKSVAPPRDNTAQDCPPTGQREAEKVA